MNASQQPHFIRRILGFLILTSAFLPTLSQLSANPLVISEFMANNSRSIQDENGDHADWIEIHNIGPDAVDLLDWCLTDNANVPTKWRFPSTNLPPGRSLLIFASEKNRRTPGAPLHTNFKLAADGEYLALIRPDLTKASEFSPAFPPQDPDTSYGHPATGTYSTWVTSETPAKAWIPQNDELGLQWTSFPFNESAWISAQAAVGYERGSGYESLLRLNLLSPALPPAQRIDINGDGVNENNSVYIRIPFTVAHPADFNSLALRMRYDDGFVAYLNGHEIARANETPHPTWNSSAASDYGDVTDVMMAITYGPGNRITLYRNGQVYGTAAASTTGSLQTYPAQIANVLLGKRHEDLGPGGTRTGNDGFLAASINEARLYNSALSATNIAALFQQGPAPNTAPLPPSTTNHLIHLWSFNDGTPLDSIGTAHGTLLGGAQIEQGRLILDGIDDFMRSDPLSATVRERTLVVWVSLDNLSQQSGSAMTIENPTGTDTFDGIVFGERLPGQWMNGSSFFDRSVPDNGGQTETVTDTAAPSGAESFNVSSALDFLLPGTNILALHALNFSLTDSDLLILPELTAGQHILTSNNPGYFSSPTPGAINGTAFQRVQATLTMDHARGFHSSPFTLGITSDSPLATIRYTLDGSAPNLDNSLVYSQPILIQRTTTLRVAAFQPGFEPTEPVTQTFIFIDDILRQTNAAPAGAHWDTEMDPAVIHNASLPWSVAQGLLDLPTVSVVMDPADLFGPNGIYSNTTARGEEWERGTSIEFFYPPGYTGRRVDNGFAINAGIQINGNYSRLTHQPKHSFRLVFKERWGASKLKFPLYPNYDVDEFDTLLLACGHNQGWSTGIENSQFLRNRFTWNMESIGATQPHIHSLSVHVYLNGMYWGIYDLNERPDDSFAAANFGGSREEYDVFKGLSTSGSTLAPHINGVREDWDQLFTIANRNLAHATNYTALSQLVDIDQLIDYNLGILYTADRDGPTGWLNGPPNSLEPKNFYASKRRTPDGRFRFWRWDSEFTLENVTEDVSERQGTQNPAFLHYKLRANPEYRLRFADHVQELFFHNGPFSIPSLITQYATLADEIDRAVVAESARWGDSKREPPFSRETDWIRERDRILNSYIPGRLNVFLSQLRTDGLWPSTPAATFQINGSPQVGGYILPNDLLSLSTTNGTIYYTLDGSDPRDPGQPQSLAPQAVPYTTPIPLTQAVVVTTRVLNGTQWSPKLRTTFWMQQDFSGLQCTEIFYNPSASISNSSPEVEFLEFKNTGTQSLHLQGIRLSGAAQFTFPHNTLLSPGGFALLVSSASAFESQYPGVPYTGVFRGNLGNAGETIRLIHPDQGALLEFNYSNTPPWPATADGHGFSLVPQEHSTTLPPHDPYYWRASSNPGGSPGRDDAPRPIPPVVINEVLTASSPPLVDAIELFNPTEAPAFIGGWFLTDDPKEPRKFRIPSNTTLPPQSFLVLDESQFNHPNTFPLSFSLSARGDQIHLFSADNTGQLTGYSHGFSFGAAPPGVSFGRRVLSTGSELFTSQQTRSLGFPNAAPLIGPVVITEIHYHPASDNDSFLELLNLTGQSVPLHEPSRPELTWRLSGLDFTFPQGFTLAPHERIVITAADPDRFRIHHSIPSPLRILGPWTGRLQNRGERLQIERPWPQSDNSIGYVTVDEVRYQDNSPWPRAADGAGASLQKLVETREGQDPKHWAAALPTPGQALPAGDAPTILTPPENLQVVAHRNAQFRVSATGTPPLFYQWWLNDRPIPGATQSILPLSHLKPADSGHYQVSIHNAYGSAISAPATLDLIPPASILQQPRSRTILARANTSFTVVAQGRGPIQYQWHFEGTPLPSATNATLSLSNVTAQAQGAYHVLVTDALGTTPSEPAYLTVLVRPLFTLHPSSQIIVQGEPATFDAAVEGTLPMTFRLRRGTTSIATQILHSTTVRFTLNHLQPTQSGTYTIAAANAANATGLVSTGAVLTVLADADGDRIPDSWETSFGLNPQKASDGTLDLDGDHFDNRSEYVAGTNPTNATSYLKLDAVLPGPPLEIRFQAVSNRTYRVEYRQDLQDGSWRTLHSLPPQPTNRTGQVFDPTPSAFHRFYRLVIP